MAVWGGYPQTVNYSTVNIAKGGGSENLLINPRGKVNQLNEAQGVVAAGQYFCDGWKAGAAGAEIYVDADGFRLISGSIVQLVPNTIEAGRNLRSNMDAISGAPVMSINGGTSNEPNGAGAYIQLEISGDNSKFTRVILAESVELPIYQQRVDELSQCEMFCKAFNCVSLKNNSLFSYQGNIANLLIDMVKAPAVTMTKSSGTAPSMPLVNYVTKNVLRLTPNADWLPDNWCDFKVVLDARP